MRICEWMASPLSKRIKRCLPTGLTSMTVRPVNRFSASGLATSMRLPSSASRRVAAVRQIVSPSGIARCVLQAEQEHRRRGGKHRERLEGEDEDGRAGTPGQRRDRKERDHRQLSGHQQLPQVGGGAFVRLAGGAVEGGMSKDEAERRQ